MPIAGVIIISAPNMADDVLIKLKKIKNVSTYGIHKENNIVAVFEGETTNELEHINNKILKEVDGVVGVFPAYVNFEDETENIPDNSTR